MENTLRVNETEFLTMEQAIAYMGKSRGYFYRMEKAKRLPKFKLGVSILYRLEDLQRLIEPVTTNNK